MSKRHPRAKAKHPVQHPARAAGESDPDRLRPLWLGATAALLVATPLSPSEAAVGGAGMVLVLGWFAVLAGLLLGMALRRRVELHWGVTDWAVAAFLVLHTVSALVMASHGQPRQTWNMLWHWLSFGVGFFLVRQLCRQAVEQRALTAVMLGLAVAISMFGYDQYFLTMPQTRAKYERDPDAELRRVGLHAPPGSVERTQFENRLYSSEPLGTFTLTNSLAAFLSPWLVCAVGIVALEWRNSEKRRWLVAAGLISALLIAGCWLLTKSRTAWVATGLALGVLVVYGRRSGRRPDWRVILALGSGGVLSFLFALVAGGFDLLVITESSKSLLYRAQYWQSTARMIADYPWLGCGTGNFQQYYTAYKLPMASESVRDPHNFLLEVWATAGTPTFLAFVAVLGSFAWQTWRGLVHRPHAPAMSSQVTGSPRVVYWGALVALVGWFIVGQLFVAGPDSRFYLFCAPVAALVILLWYPWVMFGHCSLVPLIAALLALLVNLLGAGGISFPGVSFSVWLLLALILNTAEEGASPRGVSPSVGWLLASVAVLAGACFWFTTFNPLSAAAASVAQADASISLSRWRDAEQAALQAVVEDPQAAEPRQRLAYARRALWLAQPTDAAQTQFEQAAEAVLQVNRRSSAAYTEVAAWWLDGYRVTGQTECLDQALRLAHRAVELYPQNNLGHAQLAWLLHLAGQGPEAAREAEEALRLDRINPHVEQKLMRQHVWDPGPRSAAQPAGPNGREAEQLMRDLRTRP